MSAYDHQMDRQYSAQSLSNAESSDMGSQFRMESVIYMSSCAATIFIGGLVIVAILLMTLLTTLTVMLQSCQSREAGVLESIKSDHLHLDYCKLAALNTEINSFEQAYSYSLPEVCKDLAVKYIKNGHYMNELNNSVSLVENYFNRVTPDDGGRDVVLMDIDDLLSVDTSRDNQLVYGYNRYGFDDCFRETKHMKHVFLIELYIKLQSVGWPMILLSRKPEELRVDIVKDLTTSGCGGWLKLILRSNEDIEMETRDYFSKRKTAIQEEGYRIRGVISSNMDVLIGGLIRTQNFKLANPLFDSPTHSII